MRRSCGLLLFALVLSCGSDDPVFVPQRLSEIGFGVTFSPRGFQTNVTGPNLEDFYTNFGETGPMIAFHMNWRDSVAAAGQIPDSALRAHARAQEFGFFPMVGFGWHNSQGADLTSTGEPGNNTWSNQETRANYVAMLREYCTRFRPQFLFIANEVNAYFLEATTQEWADWVSLCGEAYAAIKLASPDTNVFVTFQYEHLRGLGAKTGWTDPDQWAILGDFTGIVDAMGFTSYPHFHYETPAEVPDTYYTDITSRWSGPIIFTEIGWTGHPGIPYTGNLQEHIDYVDRFFDLTDTLDLAYVTYFLLHDLDTAPNGFRLIGLRENDGTERASLARWQARIAARNASD